MGIFTLTPLRAQVWCSLIPSFILGTSSSSRREIRNRVLVRTRYRFLAFISSYFFVRFVKVLFERFETSNEHHHLSQDYKSHKYK